MEQSAEQRRERLRALREAASQPANADTQSSPILPPPPLIHLPEPSPPPTTSAPSPSFRYYTDPLAAFSVSHRKEKPASVPDHVTPPPQPPPHPRFVPNLSWQPRLSPNNRPRPGPGPNPNPNPNPHPNHGQPLNLPLPDFYPDVQRNRPILGPSHSMHPSLNRPAMYHTNMIRPRNMFRGGSATDNRASTWKGNGRGTQKSLSVVSAITNPELYAKRSMLIDPWKDLVAVCMDSAQSRTDSNDWLPKSISKKPKPSDEKSFIVSAAGPSLANHLSASLAGAVYQDDSV